MFELALKARLPIIGVHTDDVINVRAVLQIVSKKTPIQLPSSQTKPAILTPKHLYWTEDMDLITAALYRRLVEADVQLIVINPKASTLITDTGTLEVPAGMIREYLAQFAQEPRLTEILGALQGMSLKAAGEVVQLTMARTGALTAPEVRKQRRILGGSIQGFHILETDYDFYRMSSELKNWLELNGDYFLGEGTPSQLIPRGLLLSGAPGVGKSLFSKVVAKQWGLPLVRLDIPASLNRMLGESESRITRSLAAIESYAPCVLLLDEIEKLFGQDNDGGTTTRILSQLLWWLQEHQARVLTIMTTNLVKSIPPELYRAGRIDAVVEIPMLKMEDAKEFSARVYETVLGKGHPWMPNHLDTLAHTLQDTGVKELAHSQVTQLVYSTIKKQGWAKAKNTAAKS